MRTEQKSDIQLLNVDVYRLIANCFDFPTDERLETIKELSAGLCGVGYPDEAIHTMLVTLYESVSKEDTLHDYTRIFVKGGVPLTESQTLCKFDSVPDVSAFYKAFGFSPKTGEAPDSIMYELEFLALLLLKASIAQNKESKEVTQKAYCDFLTDHAGEFSLALAKRISEGDAGTFYFTASSLLETFVTQELIQIDSTK